MADINRNDDTVTMSRALFEKVMKLNVDAQNAVSLVGGNSVQDSYRDNTLTVLREQKTLLDVFQEDAK